MSMPLLEKLTQAFGPSGRENEIRRLLKEEAMPFASDIREDELGNLIIHRKGAGGRKVMIAAHMDEIGVIITHVDEAGFLRVSPVGGLRIPGMEGQRMRLANGLTAVLAREHLERKEEKPENNQYYLDSGLNKEELSRAGIGVGDMAVPAGPFYETERTVTAKALDNRLGCYVLLETMKQVQTKHELLFTFTVQEEVGMRGAKTAAYHLQPDWAVIVDTTIADDLPRNPTVTLSLHKGPAIKVMDRSIIVHPALKNQMASVAGRYGINCQWEIIQRGATDAGPVHLSREGVPTVGLALPVRYIHRPVETASKADTAEAIRLLTKYLEEL